MEVNKNDGTTSEQQTKGILILPAKFKPKQKENTASKQQKINKFFKQQENVENNKKQQHETNTNKQQITEKTIHHSYGREILSDSCRQKQRAVGNTRDYTRGGDM